MNRFYVPDEESANTCHYSRDHKAPIAVSGVDTIDGKVKRTEAWSNRSKITAQHLRGVGGGG